LTYGFVVVLFSGNETGVDIKMIDFIADLPWILLTLLIAWCIGNMIASCFRGYCSHCNKWFTVTPRWSAWKKWRNADHGTIQTTLSRCKGCAYRSHKARHPVTGLTIST